MRGMEAGREGKGGLQEGRKRGGDGDMESMIEGMMFEGRKTRSIEDYMQHVEGCVHHCVESV